MANELRYHGTPGATVKACIKTGATRWNNSAFVAPSTIADNAWTTGMVSMTELLTSNSTPTGEFVGAIPAGVLSALGTTLTVLDIDFYENTPTPSMSRDGAQSVVADSTGAVLPMKTGASVELSATGLDAVIIESGITASASLTNDSGTQLTSINARQTIAAIASILLGIFTGGGTTSAAAKSAGNKTANRITATTDLRGNRSATALKVPD